MSYLIKMGTDADDIPQFCAECNCCYCGTGEGAKCYCSADGARFLIDIDGHDIDPTKEKPSWCKIQGKAETIFKCICDTKYWQYSNEHYQCTNCESKFPNVPKFCPECGAKIIAVREKN